MWSSFYFEIEVRRGKGKGEGKREGKREGGEREGIFGFSEHGVLTLSFSFLFSSFFPLFIGVYNMDYLTPQMKNMNGFISQKMLEKARKIFTCFNFLSFFSFSFDFGNKCMDSKIDSRFLYFCVFFCIFFLYFFFLYFSLFWFVPVEK